MAGSRVRQRSALTFAAVVAGHGAVLLLLLQHQPRFSMAQPEVVQVSMITLPQPLPPVPETIEPPAPKPKPVRKVRRAVTPPPAPIEAPSEAAISAEPAPPTPPADAESPPALSSAPPAPPAPPAPVILPRFDADYLRNPPPAYPALSRRVGEQGRVLLRVVVRPDGTPDSVVLRQSSGSARLDEAALEAVRKWRFVPARQGTTPVTAAVIVPIVFSLEG